MSQPLRILQVSNSDHGGGAELSAYNLLRAFRTQGHTSWLAVGRRQTSDPDVFVIPNRQGRTRWACWWEDRSVALRPLVGSIRGAGLASRLWASATRAVGEPLRAAGVARGREDFDYPGTWELLDLPPVRPHIVHCHNLHGSYFDLRALPWLTRQAPVVLNLRDLWLTTGHCAHPRDCERWRDGCGKCPDLSTYPSIRRDATAFNWRRKGELYAASRLYVTGPSHWTIDRARASMLSAPDYRVIPNGVDLATFHPGNRSEARQSLGLPESAFVVVFSGHNPYKDVSTMENALGRLQGSQRELRFVCLGRSASSIQPLGDGMLSSVPFVLDQRELALYYQAADVYLHATVAEVFGKAVVEAMACATPVVATSVGGIPEVVTDGETGFLAPAGDAGAIAQRLQLFIEDEHLRARLASQAASDAAARFGLDRQADAFVAWYREVIDDWHEWMSTDSPASLPIGSRLESVSP